MKPVLTISAAVESATGLALLVTPSVPASLLLGSRLKTTVGLLFYNTAAAAVLIHSGLRLELPTVGLRPIVVLYLALAIWCIARLRLASQS